MKLAARLAAFVSPVVVLLGGCGSGTQGTAAPPATSSEPAPTTESTASASPTSRSTTVPASSSAAVPKVMPDLTGMTQSAA